MTSEEFSKAAILLLDEANTSSFSKLHPSSFSNTRNELHNRAQIYAMLSVAAAQREWNDMSRDNYGAACVRTYQKG